ncbi:hypothetical protein JO388_01095 [Streptococcus suis]|uniref:hypothetical protein n=1 Tax=Streptococcus suis TaxID=1307 RepID=UPI0019619EBF|nr:hypothetical protein [Streptococcus suis]MBM7154817.1 hypothetical protein [Streptococcus suis]MBM7178877.1 hypothetical protein [Streptococcus suis]MCO8180147.1 hypothetical protein [Streptococcus suis]MDG4504614.1 hypothetical protein [Streptococcus suis]HEL1633273.1 hypothetical protein [Streptococcus suis]
MEKSKFFHKVIGLLSLCFLLAACTEAYAVKPEEDKLFEDYDITPVLEVEDYRFVADGNGIVIDWKVTNQDEVEQAGSDGFDDPAANKNYLIRNVIKRLDRNFGPTIKEMGEEEYHYLDIYDLRTPSLTKKRIDLVEVSLAYLQDENYKVYGAGRFDNLFQIGESNYTYISVGKDGIEKGLLLNLDTGLVDGEAPYTKPQLTNREYFNLSTYVEGESQLLFMGDGSRKTELYDGSINLRDVDLHAAVILDQEDAEAYTLYEVVDNTIVNQEGIIATEELFMNSGLKFYDHAYLDRVATVDGEDHRITKFEDIATYAKKPEEYDND